MRRIVMLIVLLKRRVFKLTCDDGNDPKGLFVASICYPSRSGKSRNRPPIPRVCMSAVERVFNCILHENGKTIPSRACAIWAEQHDFSWSAPGISLPRGVAFAIVLAYASS